MSVQTFFAIVFFCFSKPGSPSDLSYTPDGQQQKDHFTPAASLFKVTLYAIFVCDFIIYLWLLLE